MENTEKKVGIWQPAITYGLILGLGLVLLSIVNYALDIYQPGRLNQLIQWIIIICLIFFGQYKYRNDYKDGFISYGQALGFGVLMGLFAAIISALFTILLTQVIDPQYIDKVLQAMEQKFYQDNVPEAQITMIMENTKKFMSIGIMVPFAIFFMTLMSFIVSLITSIFIKKNENPFGKDELNS